MAEADDDQVDEALIEEVEDLPVRQGSQLEAAERKRFVDLLAIKQEHVDRLAKQVTQLGGKPCVEPSRREAIAGDRDVALRHLQEELRVARSQIDEHLRQKVALRVQLNQAIAELAELRKARA